MSGRTGRSWSFHLCIAFKICVALLYGLAPCAAAQERREREPNPAYAERRAELAAQVDAPVLLFGFTGREKSAQTYVFAQEQNFYYLTGHNEEGAALLVMPRSGKHAFKEGVASYNNVLDEFPGEALFLPGKDANKEKWNGIRLSPADPDIKEKTGFPVILPFPNLRALVEHLAKYYSTFYTILPYQRELGGYPHEKEWNSWLNEVAPQVKLKDIRKEIAALRQIKSSGEAAFLEKAIGLSVEAHLEAMRMMQPGLYEYQVAARMVEVHARGGSEAEGYAPTVGAGFNSTVLHYDKLAKKIADGDVVVLDVGAQFSGYSADITRTLPANGKFKPRQREIYAIVLGAQNAALAAVKPGMTFCGKGENSLYRIAYDYISSHGQDQHGKHLGSYFIHGLGHHIGLDVHDAGDACRPLAPGMIVTIEPGIYIPEENLGVRIEDDVLITSSGYRLLSARLPRDPDEVEKIMADAARERAKEKSSCDD